LNLRQASLPGFGHGQGFVEPEDKLFADWKLVPRQNSAMGGVQWYQAQNGRDEEPDQAGKGAYAHGVL
jgi:hypothetical protein